MSTPSDDKSADGANVGRLGSIRPFAIHLDEVPSESEPERSADNLTWKTLISADRTPSAEVVVGVASFPPGGVLSDHRHQHAEFYFGLSGDGIVAAGEVTMHIRPGTAIFIPGNAEHSIRAGDGGLSIVYGFATSAFADVIYHYSADDPG